MEDYFGLVKVFLILCGGLISACLGSAVTAITILVVLMFLDLISAIIANGRRGTIDPTAGWYGWRRKTQTLLIVISVAVLQMLGQEYGLKDLPAAEVVAGGFAVVEFLSVLKNSILCGVTMPGPLANVSYELEKLFLSKSSQA